MSDMSISDYPYAEFVGIPRRLPRLPVAVRKSKHGSAVGQQKTGGDVLLRIGDLASETGKTVRAIHLYEELGLLRPRSRSSGGYRLFGHDAVVRVRWISKLQELGMSLGDIREIILEWESMPAPGAMGRMREVYRKHLDGTRLQLERLNALERELAASLDYLEHCDSCDPDRLISACQQCDFHACDVVQPELVAGLAAHVDPLSPGASLGSAGSRAVAAAGESV
ncbi:MAG: MerR family transcriptional regulator, partial [Polyangiaceae bacterium]|nr:MerR family transcriptional regulator [Polyangiaceae bacterium]